jgi:hypothetical protein|nr:MAG TPA: hypothetical protein [Caudoviricetes sp.]
MGFGKFFKGLGRITGNLTGGLIGKSDSQRNQDRLLEEQKKEADRQAELYRQQIEEETKRRNEEADRAAAEAQRARDEQARLLREQEERAKAEDNFKRQVAQDSASITNSLLNKNSNKQTTSVDYSNAINADLTKEKDDNIDKLKKAFKRKL